SGSVPLTIATPGHFAEDMIGLIPTSQTIFSTFNLVIVAALFVAVPIVNRLMMPPKEEAFVVDPELLKDFQAASAEAE
ncbi:TIGR00366 family protein, partial [Escherichia coli]|nr:TIGR00366 family protein [Escherichia coli]